MNDYLFTSESVTEGHPDKVCDQISDAVLDCLIEQDPCARVACECCVTTGLLLVMGEITTTGYADIPKVARRVISDIGYISSEYGFDAATCGIITSIDEQSPDIALGVDRSMEGKQSNTDDIGAGDQGMMFGYACDETPSLMPMPISYAHALARRLAEVRKQGILGFLRPDGKTQVTVAYEDGRPKYIDTIVVSSQHDPDVELPRIREAITEEVIKYVIPPQLLTRDTKYFINPTGRFVTGGPCGDSGLTGRKIIVDTYGGAGSHGGGSFSGKDPTKVDRSSAYAARQVAKSVVAAGLATRCEVELSYAIGVSHPTSVCINTFGTSTVPEQRITEAVRACFDLRPSAIIRNLDLRRPIYTPLAAYGHMGREELGVLWENVSETSALLRDAVE